MPELPEVEVVRRGLAQHVVGRRITDVTVLDPRSVRRHLAGPHDFTARLTGRTVVDARRRGKYLWLAVDEGDAVLCHLGMSGQFRLGDADTEAPRHLRIALDLDDGVRVFFADQRIFGGMAFSEDGAELPPEIEHIARDPLDPEFDAAGFTTRLRTRQTGIKRALLDQTLISGIGNIYADEALWRARLHGARPTDALSRAQVRTVLGAAAEVMDAALAAGGTSFDALYVNVNGASGYFDRSLAVYGQADRPCPRCGTPVRREPFMNRSSYSCPRCQRVPLRDP